MRYICTCVAFFILTSNRKVICRSLQNFWNIFTKLLQNLQSYLYSKQFVMHALAFFIPTNSRGIICRNLQNFYKIFAKLIQNLQSYIHSQQFVRVSLAPPRTMNYCRNLPGKLPLIYLYRSYKIARFFEHERVFELFSPLH